MKVFVTGATGFVGRELTRQLLSAGHLPVCLVLPGCEEKLVSPRQVVIHGGDVTRPDSLEGMLRGCDAVIHLVGIIREDAERGITFNRLHVEGTLNMLVAAQRQGVRRFIQMSSNGADPAGETAYYRTKWQAEEAVRHSGLSWTIFRPSIIFGKEDNFCNKLAELIRRLPVIPVIGDGQYRIAPVAVEDVVKGLLTSLNRPDLKKRIVYCCGSEIYTFNELLDLVGSALGRGRVRKLHQPLSLFKPVVARMEKRRDFPITLDQLTMLLKGNVCNGEPSLETIGISPRSFPETLRDYLSPASS